MSTFPPPPTKPFKRSKISLGPVKKPTIEDVMKDESIDMSAAVEALEHFVDSKTNIEERSLAAEEGKSEDDEEGSSSEDDENTKPHDK